MRLDRRRFHRPRAALRHVLLTALTFASPPAGKKMMATARNTSGPGLVRRIPISTERSSLWDAELTNPAFVSPAPSNAALLSPALLNPAHLYDELIAEAAALYKLEPALIRAVIRAESQFNPKAVSRAGAVGLMQLMPQVAAELGAANPFDPRENIMAGAQLLRRLLDRHHENVALTLASYNAGPAAVAHSGNRVPPFRETRRYVKLITGWLEKEDNQGH